MPNGRVATTQSAWHSSLYEFGQFLRDKRQHVLNLSQADMGTRVGLDQSAISRIESGHKPRDKASLISLMASSRL